MDKIDGTNICCIFKDGILQSIDNRKNRVMENPNISVNFNTETYRALEGIINAIKKKWIEKDFSGRIYGELVGPTININLHDLDRHYFVPFYYLKKHCKWNSWNLNKYPKTFESIRKWFECFPSLFSNRINKCISSVAEGIVFYHPDGKMAKLRTDMFF